MTKRSRNLVDRSIESHKGRRLQSLRGLQTLDHSSPVLEDMPPGALRDSRGSVQKKHRRPLGSRWVSSRNCPHEDKQKLKSYKNVNRSAISESIIWQSLVDDKNSLFSVIIVLSPKRHKNGSTNKNVSNYQQLPMLSWSYEGFCYENVLFLST